MPIENKAIKGEFTLSGYESNLLESVSMVQKSSEIFDTGIKLVRNVGTYNVGRGSLKEVTHLIEIRKNQALVKNEKDHIVFLVDSFYKNNEEMLARLPIQPDDFLGFIDVDTEPTTENVDKLVKHLCENGYIKPAAIVGMGGGITLDTSKAVSNLLTNGGCASDYQGWDLVQVPGIYKIGIPTISGTGAEATRTCVMTNTKSGLKLGMNSDFTVFDHIILDSELTGTVPRNQYFYTGMDAYIHCIEALAGTYRNPIGDAFSRETINLCRSVFTSEEMMSAKARDDLMVASYLGGCSIATSYVGVVHPFSAGLSVVLGVHHCLANCITMRAMEGFYPEAFQEFWAFVERQHIAIPKGIASNLSPKQYQALIDATVIHKKPLTNALGENYRDVLSDEKIISLFKLM